MQKWPTGCPGNSWLWRQGGLSLCGCLQNFSPFPKLTLNWISALSGQPTAPWGARLGKSPCFWVNPASEAWQLCKGVPCCMYLSKLINALKGLFAKTGKKAFALSLTLPGKLCARLGICQAVQTPFLRIVWDPVVPYTRCRRRRFALVSSWRKETGCGEQLTMYLATLFFITIHKDNRKGIWWKYRTFFLFPH